MTSSQLSFGLVIVLVVAGCGDNAGSDGTGGNNGAGGDSTMLTPCQGFCSLAVDCGFLASESACETTCENDITGATSFDPACGARLERRYECLVPLSCQELDDWNSEEPPDAFPCIAEETAADTACGN